MAAQDSSDGLVVATDRGLRAVECVGSAPELSAVVTDRSRPIAVDELGPQSPPLVTWSGDHEGRQQVVQVVRVGRRGRDLGVYRFDGRRVEGTDGGEVD